MGATTTQQTKIRGLAMQEKRARVEISNDGIKYKGNNDYLPAVLKHSKDVELIKARKSLLENFVVISPVLLIIILCSVLISNNLKLQSQLNYEQPKISE